jgi:hypothetical protein
MMVLMSDETAVPEVPDNDPRTVELVLAIHGGDTGTVGRLLAADPALARAAGSVGTQRQNLVDWLKERGAAEG